MDIWKSPEAIFNGYRVHVRLSGSYRTSHTLWLNVGFNLHKLKMQSPLFKNYHEIQDSDGKKHQTRCWGLCTCP